MKRLLSLLLVLSMAVSLAVPAGAAEDATAATMRLESTEGTVTVKNASGLSVSLRDKMRLFDGYSVKTAAKSYAYISLDGDKTLKLDASSEASVSKSGKKLEIVLVSGSLFFNVVKPLESSETLNIRTSTMVAGIRGTSACVSIPSREVTEITLLTGRLGVTGRDTHSGRMETVEMVAGERTVVAQVDAGTPQERLEIQKSPVQEAEVPGFAAVEVAKDPELQSKIETETELSVPLIIEDAEERLTADETAAQQAETEVRKRLAEREKEIPNVVQSSFGQTSGGGSGGGSGGSGGGGSSSENTVTLPDPTETELLNALNSAGVVNLKLSVNPAAPSLTVNSPLTVPAGTTLNLQGGVLECRDALTVNGTMTVQTGAALYNNGDMTVNGTMTVQSGGKLTNYGTLTVTSTNSLHVHGTLENRGALNVGTTGDPGLVEVSGTGSTLGLFTSYSPGEGVRGTVTIAKDSTLRAAGESRLALGGDPVLLVKTDGTVILPADTRYDMYQRLVGSAEDFVLMNPDVGGKVYTRTGIADMEIEIRAKSHTVTFVCDHSQVKIQYDSASGPKGEGYTVEVPTSVNDFSFEPRPAAGYAILTVLASPGVEELMAQSNGWFRMGTISADVTVEVITKTGHTVAIEGSSFEVSLDGETTLPVPRSFHVVDGESFSFYLKPATGVGIMGVTCDGKTLTPDETGRYTIGPVTKDTTVTVEVTAPTTLTDPTLAELKQALNDYAEVNLEQRDNSSTTSVFALGITEALTIPAGKTLNLVSGALSLCQETTIHGTMTTANGTKLFLSLGDTDSINGGRVTVEPGGTLSVDGALELSGAELFNEGELTISGSAHICAGQTLYNQSYGTMTLSGELKVDGQDSSSRVGTLANAINSTLEVDKDGTLTFIGEGVLYNYGTLTNHGTLTADNGTTFVISSGGRLDNDGKLEIMDGTLSVDDGTLSITGGSVGAANSYSSIELSIRNAAGTVELSGGNLMAAKIGGSGAFKWTGGTLKCKSGVSPVETTVTFTHAGGYGCTEESDGFNTWYIWTLTG